jgi:hypothetical protein
VVPCSWRATPPRLLYIRAARSRPAGTPAPSSPTRGRSELEQLLQGQRCSEQHLRNPVAQMLLYPERRILRNSPTNVLRPKRCESASTPALDKRDSDAPPLGFFAGPFPTGVRRRERPPPAPVLSTSYMLQERCRRAASMGDNRHCPLGGHWRPSATPGHPRRSPRLRVDRVV